MRLESLWADVRFAFRVFKRSPAVALTVIATLAVALGLNATAYSFFNAYVVKPADVRDPGTLYHTEPALGDTLEKYVKDIMSTFKNDKRILLWDIFLSKKQIEPALGQAAGMLATHPAHCTVPAFLLQQWWRI